MRNVLSAIAGRRSSAERRVARIERRSASNPSPRPPARAPLARHAAAACPSSVVERHVDGASPARGSVDDAAGRRRWPSPITRERAALAAAQRHEARRAPLRRARARSAPAPRCTRSRAATCPARRSARAQARCARRARLRDQLRAPRSTGRPRRRRGSTGSGCASPSAQQRVDDLLRAALHLGVAALHGGEIELLAGWRPPPCDEAAPPPRPISIAGPPSTTSGAPRGNRPLLDVRRARTLPEAARDHDRLVVAAHADARSPATLLLEGAEVAERCRGGRTRC